MTVPGDPTREQPAVEPTVSTEPAPGHPRAWWSAIPRHLGRARTSTVIIAVLFLAIGTLYLYVKPDPETVTSPADDTGGVTEPASTTPVDPTTTPPTDTQPAPTTTVDPTTVPSTTTEVPTTESVVPTTESVPPPTTDTAPVPTVPPTGTPTG